MPLTNLDLKTRTPQRFGFRINRYAVKRSSYLTDKQRAECAKKLQNGDIGSGEKLIASSLGQIH